MIQYGLKLFKTLFNNILEMFYQIMFQYKLSLKYAAFSMNLQNNIALTKKLNFRKITFNNHKQIYQIKDS